MGGITPVTKWPKTVHRRPILPFLPPQRGGLKKIQNAFTNGWACRVMAPWSLWHGTDRPASVWWDGEGTHIVRGIGLLSSRRLRLHLPPTISAETPASSARPPVCKCWISMQSAIAGTGSLILVIHLPYPFMHAHYHDVTLKSSETLRGVGWQKCNSVSEEASDCFHL